MSVVELDISTSPEDLFRSVGCERGAFWIDGQTVSGATFMSFAPEAQLVVHARDCVEQDRSGRCTPVRGDALSAIEAFVARGTPFSSSADAPHTVGFFAYDLAGLVEPHITPRRDASCTLPLARLARYDAVLEVMPADARTVRVHATSAAAAERCASALRHKLGAGAAVPQTNGSAPQLLETPRRDAHVRAVEHALAYIAAGDVYQVNLAQPFRVRSDDHPSAVYLRLRAAQRVPFGAYLDCEGFSILCGSPERFLRVAGSSIATEPIKGTRPRGGDAASDAALRAALVADPKERAEHVMIVDLERNDLGRVCTSGSVTVPSLMRVESFATLHHMVSTVRGTLRDQVGLADLLRATFPGGSITGAPKIRAAQVIAELEAQPRELYTGAIVWFRGARDFDSAIAIRTIVAQDGVYTYHAGGGIVADSEPQREYAECLLKAEPFLRAMRLTTPHAASARAPQPDVAIVPGTRA